jgi:hypothetical protein
MGRDVMVAGANAIVVNEAGGRETDSTSQQKYNRIEFIVYSQRYNQLARFLHRMSDPSR